PEDDTLSGPAWSTSPAALCGIASVSCRAGSKAASTLSLDGVLRMDRAWRRSWRPVCGGYRSLGLQHGSRIPVAGCDPGILQNAAGYPPQFVGLALSGADSSGATSGVAHRAMDEF